MTQSFNIITLIFLLGATQGIFLALLLFNKSGNKSANRFLAWLLLSYSAFIAEATISRTGIGLQVPHLLGLAAGAIYLVGPFHYLYARSLISPDFSFGHKHLLHFLPFAVFYLSLLFPFYLRSGAGKIAYFQNIEVHGPTPLLIFFSWAILVQGIVYLSVTLYVLKKHRRRIKDAFSSVDKINLNWLRNITFMSLALWGLGLVIEVLQVFDIAPLFDLSVPVTTAILIYAMGYLGLRQPEIFSGSSGIKELKYERSGLSPEKAKILHDQLIQVMKSKKPFIESDLKLGQLAQLLKTSPNHLSQVVNENCRQNFFDFVNRYRIEEAKRLIAETSSQNLTLLSIAYDVGFNSKSAFNTAFKKHADITPSQYRSQVTS
ncbi:helix-turn-helix domain-containing protein [candidate division KSB1 bacterium]|nr:helix-turn-helix domain-containing protein [candidate division KSB1 bacterium]